MRWIGVIDRATGDLRSVATELPDELPDELDAVDLGEHEEPPAGIWNSGTRRFDPVPTNLDEQAAKLPGAFRAKLRGVATGAETFTAAERDRALAALLLRIARND